MRRIDYITNSYDTDELELETPDVRPESVEPVCIGSIFYPKNEKYKADQMASGVIMKIEENHYVVRIINNQTLEVVTTDRLAILGTGDFIAKLEKEIFHSAFQVL